MQDDQEFLEYVVKKIVSHPEDVETSREVDERGVLLTLDVNADDMGHVIGRDGQTARALRTLLKIVGAQNNARVNLKINEPEGSEGPSGGEGSEPSDEEEDIDTSAVDDLDI
ncbi:MAG: KH domain-containing protein [Candidatus Paceibacteria bacterium]